MKKITYLSVLMLLLTLVSFNVGATLKSYQEKTTPIVINWTSTDNGICISNYYDVDQHRDNAKFMLFNYMMFAKFNPFPVSWVVSDIILEPDASYTGGNYSGYVTIIDKSLKASKIPFTYNGQKIHLKDIWSNFTDSVKYIANLGVLNSSNQWLTYTVVANSVTKNYEFDSTVYLTDAKPTIDIKAGYGVVYKSGDYYTNYYSVSKGDSIVNWFIRSKGDVVNLVNLMSDTGSVIKHNGRTLTNAMILKYSDAGYTSFINQEEGGKKMGKPSTYPEIFNDTVHFTYNGLEYDSIYIICSNIIKKKIDNTILEGSIYTLDNGKKITSAGVYIDSVAENLNDGYNRTYGHATDYVYDSLDSRMKIYSLTMEIISTQKNSTISASGSYTLPSGRVVTKSGIYYDSIKYTAYGQNYYKINKVTLTITEGSSYTTQELSGMFLASAYNSDSTYTLMNGKKINDAGLYVDTVSNVIYKEYVSMLLKDTVSGMVNLDYQYIPNADSSNLDTVNYKLANGQMVREAGLYMYCETYSPSEKVNYYYLHNELVSNKQTVRTAINSGSIYTLPSGKKIEKAGVYVDSVKYSADSSITINNVKFYSKNLSYYKIYIVSLSTIKTEVVIAYNTYTLPNGEILTKSGSYYDSVKYMTNGVDYYMINKTAVVIVSNLFITKHNIKATFNPDSTETYSLPSGIKVKQLGIYVDSVLEDKNGIIYKHIYTISLSSIKELNVTIDSSQYTLPSGKIVTKDGNYTDSIKFVFNDTLAYYNIFNIHLKLNTKVGINTITDVIKVYPNPMVNELRISDYEGMVSIFDMSGKLVLKQTIFTDDMINVSNLRNGMYIVKGSNFSQKVLKR